MIEKLNGIVLKNNKFSETSVISKIFTDKYGVLDFIINSVRNNKGSIKSSQIQPLSILELEIYKYSNREIHRIKELRCSPVLVSIRSDVAKSSVAQFVSEILTKILHEQETNIQLYNYIRSCVLTIENDILTPLFPQLFICKLCSFIGVTPNIASNHASIQNLFFDMQNGIIGSTQLNNYTITDNHIINCIIQLYNASEYSGLHTNLNFNKADKRKILELLCEYLKLHATQGREIKSHEVLFELFE